MITSGEWVIIRVINEPTVTCSERSAMLFGMAHTEGAFRAFRVDNGISLVLVVGDDERRIHLRQGDNAALFAFLEGHLIEPAETSEE